MKLISLVECLVVACSVFSGTCVNAAPWPGAAPEPSPQKNRPGPRPGRKSGFTYSRCFTTWTSTSTKSVPTVSRTFSGQYTVTRVRHTTPKTTTTPDPRTKVNTETAVSTIIETQQSTDTLHSTITQTESTTKTTDTSTIVSTVRTTSRTTSTTTQTVPAPAGFTGIQDSLAGATYNNALQRRSDEIEGKLMSPRENHSPLIAGPEDARARYPKIVHCNIFVQTATFTTVTSTAATTITKRAPTPVVHTTVTTTTESTSTTVLDDASTTLFDTTTLTSTATETPLATSTTTITTEVVTDIVPAPTPYYALCTRNAANNVNGRTFVPGYAQFYRSTHSRTYPFATTPVQNGYDCCQLCAQNPISELCYMYEASAGNLRCQVVYSASARTCPPQTEGVQIQLQAAVQHIGFSNGYCAVVDRVAT